jgi:hypothetical protein
MNAISDGIYKEDAILSTDIELIEVNKQNLLRGLSALGAKITPPYKNDRYAQRKQQKNALPPYGIPDIYNTGSFQSRIEFHIAGRVAIWEDSDPKAVQLLEKYGSLLGVFENDLLEKYRILYALPALVREVKNRMKI